MNRAEKRRQKNLAKKAARKAKPGKAASRPPGQQTPAIQQSLESAVRHHTQGRLPEAESIYQQILQADPNQPVALHLLGVIAHQVGKHNTAVDLITKALAIKPDFAEAHNNLGNTFNELGRLDEAMASFHNALAIKPDYVDAHNNLGNTFQELGRLDEAMASYLKALSLKPDYPEAHNNLGSAFNELGRLDEATTSYLKALSLKPDYDEAHNNLGIALHNQGKLEEAVASYDKALAIKPDFAEAHNNLGKAFKDLGRLDEAVASYDKALAIKPDFAEAHNNLGSVFNELGQLDEALQCLAKAVECKPGLTEAHSNFLATRNYVPDGSSTEMFAEARRYGEIIAARAEPLRQHSNVPNVNRRLRVGMVSGDLRRHPVGHHLDNVLSTLDRDSLAIFLYSTSVKEDDLTARLKSNVAQWRNVAGVGDDQLYETIIADEIDILVDLAGHTARNRLPVFSRKPAPVQVTWLGYIATTGVVAIDYILCDRWVLPPEDESYFVETPWRLPGSYICFTPPNLEIGVGVLPAQRDGRVTFGSFNNLQKVNDSVIACWTKLLRAVPGSRLFLKTKQFANAAMLKDVESRFAGHGVDPERLMLEGPSPRSELLASYNRVDIGLDPFPFTGVTTSVEALWMGVPVLTLKGDRFVSHSGESILHNIGLSDWIAVSHEDYVEKAADFASNLPALSAVREGLRERLLRSPVCDAPRFARNLEDCFRGMWREWCERKAQDRA